MAGRPRNRTTIVDEIFDHNSIICEDITFLMLGFHTCDNLSVIQWLAKRRLIVNNIDCGNCSEPCSLSRYSETADGWRWRCCRDNFTRSIRWKSFFNESHLSLQKILYIIYMWCYDYPQNIIARESAVSKHSIVDWCNFIREICEEYLELNPQLLGGIKDDCTPKIVEIGESKYFHRKYHRGQWQTSHWVFGAVERNTGRCCLIEVPDRRRETLLPIIRQWILPGSRIISDGWAAYAQIEHIDDGVYMHDVVVHERENTWIRAKKKLRRQCKTKEELFPSYMAEFLWRHRVGENKFGEMLCSISHLYC